MSVGGLALFLVAGAFVLAQPGGRHPILMSLVGLLTFGFGLAPVRRLMQRWSTRNPRVAVAGWLVACLGLAIVGVTELPLSMRLRIDLAEMDATAQEILAAAQASSDVEAFNCFETRGRIGPFEYTCGRTADDDSGWVMFNLYERPNYISEGQAGLIYAPQGVPDPDGCSNRLVGDWYEVYWPRFEDSACLWGVGG